MTSLISFACNRLRGHGWSLLVSFADWTHTHHGGVYQAASWAYAGCRDRSMDGLIIGGVFRPGRACDSAFGTRSPSKMAVRLPGVTIEAHYDEGKHCYWRALNRAGHKKAKRLELGTLPYPKPDHAN